MKHTVGFAAVVTAMMVIALIVGGAYMVVVLATRHEPIETIGVTFLLGLGVLFSLWLIITPRQATISGLVFGVLCVGAIPRHIIPFSGAFMGLRLCFVSLALLMSIRKFSRCHVRSKRNPYAILLVFYTLIVLLWLPKSPAFTYGIQKTVEFILNATVPMLAFAGLGPYDENDCKVIATTLIVWAIVAAVSLLVVGNIGSYRSVRSEGENAIMTARVIGLGAVSQVGVIVSGSRKRIGACVAQLAILGVTIVAMIATGSRGPFLALILSIIVLLMLSRQYDGRWRGFWRILAYFGGLLILGVLLPIEWRQMGGYTRLFGYLTRDVLAPKDSARRYLFMAALQGVSESRFMGLGTGGFASFLGVEYRQYPHNLLLEVLAEQGFVGFMMVATMMLITTFRVVRYRNHIGPMQRVIVSGWVFGLVNALVSGDIGTNSMFWVIGGLIWNLSVDMHLPRIDESSEQRLIDYRMVDNHDQSE